MLKLTLKSIVEDKDGKEKIEETVYTQLFISSKKLRNAMKFMKRMEASNQAEIDGEGEVMDELEIMDETIGVIVDAFDNKFTFDEFLDGVPVNELRDVMDKTLAGILNGGSNPEQKKSQKTAQMKKKAGAN
ncbi:hypothetical protein QUF79_14640 [Fictibacillus enclensis]|uniref:phage tail assembly chaperone G n=1 Tax=Fictibacillus enclensis TaxID=1017270 RepID=UPI0025A2BB84|nr:hypothetical protein [Fictibacillus enclensis]MDM5199256.1 hypothetical protein [Fictibacillus enclensis]